ncbi:aldehyde dehydrogenase [Pelagibius litoralis]|uniref:Aldehyde dehydrogenase n=1 Tax=Pelagibius litoralis TaxID=374515 RepID=A0A967EX72_9PROT|nr:aldehyde dehydrogenase family protein [Pelagibius litoralis]NIA68045.1 aldehyde dehydrogenase [Pelagibius litoralis]
MAAFDPFARQIFSGNDFVAATTRAEREIVDPGKLEPVGRIALCDAAEVARVAAAAAEAQRDWRQRDAKARAVLLHGLADAIESSDFHDVAQLMVREMGKPYPEATGELANAGAVFRYFAEMARDEAGRIAGTTQAGSFQYARYEPYGVSAHIMPFNFPILLMCWTLAASLAAGNACIVKPAEATSLCTLKFMEHFRLLPEGLVSCITGDGETAQALIRQPAVQVVAFTGGLAAGRRVAVACAELMKPCIIEAGGNDALIVSEHAPLDVAIAGSVTAAFHLSGQVCTSAERFFVHEKIHDAFVEGFVAATRNLRVGYGLDESEIGPLVSEAARERVAGLVEAARAEGATLACGGRVPPALNTGWYYEPTVLTGVTPEMAVMRGEVFGPVAAVCKVASLAEALDLANCSDFGLGASIFTGDLAEAQRAAETLEAGMVWVNNPLIDNDALPFGGWKLSGMGRELGRHGLDAFRQSKMVIVDADPKVQDWWYPYPREWFYGKAGRGF